MRVRMIERVNQETIECRFLTDEATGRRTGFRLGRPAWNPLIHPRSAKRANFLRRATLEVAPGSGFLDAATGTWIESISSMSTWDVSPMSTGRKISCDYLPVIG